MWSKEVLDSDDMTGSKSVSHSFPDDTVIMRLCLWLMHLSVSKVGLLLRVLWFHNELIFFFLG